MSRSRMAWGVVLYAMWARSSWPQRSQRQRSGRGQRTSKPWPSWWRSYPVISTPEGKSISIVTLATVYHLVGAAGPISMPSSRTPWGSETGMITPESASDQVPRKSSVSHLKTEEPQLFAPLALREFLKTDYRGLEAILRDWAEVRDALGLTKVPDHSTLQKAARRLLEKS